MASPSAAHANGRIVDFVRQTAGPYEIALGTIPSTPVVGRLHMTMTITAISTQELVLDAVVVVSGAGGPDSEAPELGPFTAQNNLNDPSFYDVNTSVDRVGTWSFTVSVSGDAGEGTSRFPIEVKESSPVRGIVTLLVLVALVVIVGLSLRAYLTEKGGRGKRASRKR